MATGKDKMFEVVETTLLVDQNEHTLPTKEVVPRVRAGTVVYAVRHIEDRTVFYYGYIHKSKAEEIAGKFEVDPPALAVNFRARISLVSARKPQFHSASKPKT